MPFTESLRADVRKRAHLRCCLCHSIGVDIHHIIPKAEGGLDADDNAAPLCPSCHETYGANPQKRKFIREARDLWFEICAARFANDRTQLNEIAEALRGVATKDDLARLAVRNSSYILGPPANTVGLPADYLRYSFVRDEFVHPLIVRELVGWLSDASPTIVAVDLAAANQSNRCFGEFSSSVENGRTWVQWAWTEREWFRYAYIATSPSGVQMVECYDRGGGTGVFGHVGFFALEGDRALAAETGEAVTRPRVILKTLGSIGLGDRFAGEIVYRAGLLKIGPDHGWFQRGEQTRLELPVQ